MQAGNLGWLEIRHQIDGQRKLQVRFALRHLVDVAAELHARRKGGPEAVLFQRPLARFVHRFVDDLSHHRLAVGLLEERHRGFARTEALEMNARLHLLDPAGQAGVEIGAADMHLKLPVQAFGNGFGNLHLSILKRICRCGAGGGI